ncbi:uracil-DNA glycosylase [Bartonella sp. DGB1]|uniref:uracil-DNA glycosylase n=1 Tax=Bartonella sp. DGB1 TaxID=3239807 RepID=UPI00352587EC
MRKVNNNILVPNIPCKICIRLYNFLQQQQLKNPDWYNAPITSFLPVNQPYQSEILIVGLAPGLQGANRTGRPFTGDHAGILLYNTLRKYGFAIGDYDPDANDNLQLVNCIIANAVRCVPPQNKPTTDEINNCRGFLASLIENLPNLKVIIPLGTIAHNSLLKILKLKIKDYPFKHGALGQFENKYILSSYHCSRYNTQTNRLTTQMFEDIFSRAKSLIS